MEEAHQSHTPQKVKQQPFKTVIEIDRVAKRSPNRNASYDQELLRGLVEDGPFEWGQNGLKRKDLERNASQMERFKRWKASAVVLIEDRLDIMENMPKEAKDVSMQNTESEMKRFHDDRQFQDLTCVPVNLYIEIVISRMLKHIKSSTKKGAVQRRQDLLFGKYMKVYETQLRALGTKTANAESVREIIQHKDMLSDRKNRKHERMKKELELPVLQQGSRTTTEDYAAFLWDDIGRDPIGIYDGVEGNESLMTDFFWPEILDELPSEPRFFKDATHGMTIRS